MAAKRQDLYIDTQDVVHEDIITDKLRLNQVLLNLVSNAIKFTPAGGTISIRVSEKPCEMKQYTTYEFRIKDNGIGMSKEFQKEIFDSFTRESTSTTSGIQGTGLGMAITKNIVDMMGGTIEVKSEEAKEAGVTAFVAKPLFMSELRSALTTPILVEEPEKLVGSGQFQGKKVLLVEDNELNLEIASAILQEEGLVVDTARDGVEAVNRMAAAGADDYDLILMDVQMPQMDGYTATR